MIKMRRMKKMKILLQSVSDRQVQRMRNMLVILALFVCTSICLGQQVATVPKLGKPYNYTANVKDVGVCDQNINGANVWLDPVNCTLNITNDGSLIDKFACGARMSSKDKNFKDRHDQPTIQGPMIGNKINVCTGWFENSIISGAYSEDISGKVDNNEVSITHIQGGNIWNVYGSRAYDTSASSNTVTISGVVIYGYIKAHSHVLDGAVYGGYVLGDGLASSNTVTIERGEIKGHVYGGFIGKKGTATLNRVNLTSVTVSGNVYGGMLKNGLARDNKVRIDGNGNSIGSVYGGYIVNDGTATLNEVNLTSVTVTKDVCGARIGNGLARDNRVTIKDGKIEGEVYGGHTLKGTVSSNTVTITSGAVHAVFGGYIGEKGTATLNEVNLTSVTVSSDVYGARIGRDGYGNMFMFHEATGDGLVSSNTVTIKGGKIKGTVYGGRTSTGTVSSNTVTITSGTVDVSVYGGYINQKGTATLNTVNLTSATVSSDVYGAWIRNGLVSSNTVTITSGIVGASVFGGCINQKGTVSSNTVTITTGTTVTSDVVGGCVNNGDAIDNRVTIKDGKIKGGVTGGYIVNDGTATGNTVNLTSVTVTKSVYGAWVKTGLARDNTVTITDGIIGAEDGKEGSVYGGCIIEKGTATGNTVNLTSVTVGINVVGGGVNKGDAIDNRVTIKDGKIKGGVFGGCIIEKGTATVNTVDLTSVTVSSDVYGARIDQNGYASSNTVIINGGKIGGDVLGGYIVNDGTATGNTVNLTSVNVTSSVFGAWIRNGYASSNTVTINGGKTGGNVFGGYVKGNGKAIYNTITITGTEQSFPEFSTTTILCGGICASTTTNNAFTGNTLNIVETKGVEVNGISNFENYNFHLKDIKPGETILTATSGGCSWDVGKFKYTPACAVDLSSSNIYLCTKGGGGVLNKGEYCTLIKSPKGFKDNVVKTKQFDFENEGSLVKYYWEIKIADNKQELIAILTDKRIRDEGVAKSLSEGYGTGIVCTNNGMDFVLSKMEETESVLGEGAKLQRKGEIGVFCGLAANKSKSSYNEGSHIDMTGMSMMGGVGIRVEVGGKKLSSKELSSEGQSPKEQSSKEFSSKEQSSKKLSLKELISELSFKKLSSELTVGVFGEYGTGNSDIDSGLCPCEKKSEGKSKYVGGGLLGRYSICKDEFSGTKGYVEAILRAGQVKNSFNIKGAKDSTGKEYGYDDEPVMYGGCALGVGCKHKASEKIDLDYSLRYMFGYQCGKDVERVDADGNGMNFESVKSKRIRVGVRGKYVELEKVKPYIGIWYEHELSGKVKGAIQNGVDNVGDIPASSFGGGTGIMEVGASGKVWKLGVDISGQGYLGVRKGFGGMLKLKYAFGKDAHAKPQPKDK